MVISSIVAFVASHSDLVGTVFHELRTTRSHCQEFIGHKVWYEGMIQKLVGIDTTSPKGNTRLCREIIIIATKDRLAKFSEEVNDGTEVSWASVEQLSVTFIH